MMRELKQALLDIEFLQECNNSVNLALSVTRKELAVAKAELAAEREKRGQAEAQCAAMQTAINRYVFGNIELLDALKAALEGK